MQSLQIRLCYFLCLWMCPHTVTHKSFVYMWKAKVGVTGPLKTLRGKVRLRTRTAIPTSSGEAPGCVCVWCTLERVLTDVVATKCVHICMFYSMFVWEAMMMVYISSTFLFFWHQQVYHGIFCDSHHDVYNVWIIHCKLFYLWWVSEDCF